MVIEPDVFSDNRGFLLDSSMFCMAPAGIRIASDFAEVQYERTNF